MLITMIGKKYINLFFVSGVFQVRCKLSNGDFVPVLYRSYLQIFLRDVGFCFLLLEVLEQK